MSVLEKSGKRGELSPEQGQMPKDWYTPIWNVIPSESQREDTLIDLIDLEKRLNKNL